MSTHPAIQKIILCLGCLQLAAAGTALAADLDHAKDGSGVYGYKDTPKLPWCQWLVHDPDRPNPKRVDPGKAGPPAPVPADAIVLFDGRDASKWVALGDWKIDDSKGFWLCAIARIYLCGLAVEQLILKLLRG